MENLMTIEYDEQEFKINSPVTTSIVYTYDDENRISKSETNVNATLIGGVEETRISEFLYDETGFRTVSKSSNEDKEVESVITHDDKDRILKIETPITITEYEYTDDGYTVTEKDKLKEMITVSAYKTIDGEDRQVSSVVSTATGDVIAETYHNYSLEDDTMELITKNKFNPKGSTRNIYSYSTGLLLYTEDGIIGEYDNARLKYEYDENNILSVVYVLNDDDTIKDTIEYEIEKVDETSYITKSKYESVCTTKDGHLDYIDRVIFTPVANSDQDVHTQQIKLGEYEVKTTIDVAFNNVNGSTGKCEFISIDSPKSHIYHLNVTDNKGDTVMKSYLIDFRIEDKRYFIDTGYENTLTKASITKYINISNDLSVEYETEEIVFKTADNDSSLLDYIISKLKLYIESEDDLKEILKMSKVSLDI